MTPQRDWLPAQKATLEKLERLREHDHQAAAEIEKIWPVTLNALRAGINPIRAIKVGKTITTTVEIAHRQLDDDLDLALAETDRG